MDVAVPCVIPYALCFEFERVEVGGGLIVSLRVGASVASAADVAADETDPEIRRRFAGGTGGEGGCGGVGEWDGARGGGCAGVRRHEGLRVPTYRAP